MNRCLQSGFANIEEVIGFFADNASYLDESGLFWNGKASIRKRFLRFQPEEQAFDCVVGIDLLGPLVILRLERLRVFITGKYGGAEVKPHIQVILLSQYLDRSGFEEWLQIYIVAKMSLKRPSIKDFHHGLSINL